MKKMVFVDPQGTAGDEGLAAWVEAGGEYAASPLAGFTVLRFGERQIEEGPGRVVADVARALGAGKRNSG